MKIVLRYFGMAGKVAEGVELWNGSWWKNNLRWCWTCAKKARVVICILL